MGRNGTWACSARICALTRLHLASCCKQYFPFYKRSIQMFPHISNNLHIALDWKPSVPVTIVSTVFWNVTPCGPVDVSEQRSAFILRVVDILKKQRATSWLVTCLAYSSILKAVHSSEVSVNVYRTRRRHVPEDSSFHSHCCVRTSNPV
jgi:hypothetical protein